MLSKRLVLSALVLLAASLLSGCAMTLNPVKVNYKFNPALGGYEKAKSQQGVQVAKVVDARTASDPKFLFAKTNLNGDRTTGGYLAEEPVADIVARALREGLAAAGFGAGEQAAYEISARIEELDYAVKMGFWKGEMTGKLTVKVFLHDTASRELVANETFNVRAKLPESEKISPEAVFRVAVDRFVVDVLSSEVIRAKIK
jgi:uncharacterized lipoprotein YajG